MNTPKKVLVDTNVWIDIIAKRAGFHEESTLSLQYLNTHNTQLFASSTTITDIYYVCRKIIKPPKLYEMIETLVDSYSLAIVDDKTIRAALHADQTDFEDAVQSEVASQFGCEAILTRNLKDFEKSVIPAYAPSYFSNLFFEKS